jgi:type II secretory pathway pseudopilin PulG
MMNKARAGFMLLEAILAIVIVSICLTLIAQSLLSNFRTGLRFQEMVRSMVVMENRLGLLYVTSASDEDFDPNPQPLDKPYDKFVSSTQKNAINDHLKNIDLRLNWPAGHAQGQLDVTTIIYNPDEN